MRTTTPVNRVLVSVCRMLATGLPLPTVLIGCGGEPFASATPNSESLDAGVAETAPLKDAPLDRIEGSVDSKVAESSFQDAAPESGPDAAEQKDSPVVVQPDAEPESTVTGPCGVLQSDDAPSFTREICILAGSFEMGSSTPNLGESFADHTPPHSVSVSAFVLDAYEVTVGRFRACVDAAACKQPLAGTWTPLKNVQESFPITHITWNEAQNFCVWEGKKSLPTEAQWEYVARGPQSTVFPWGDEFECSRAVLGGFAGGPCEEYAGLFPKPAGAVVQNSPAASVFDLIGNVAEWVADWAGSYPSAPTVDPKGPASGGVKVIRGGSWSSKLDFGFGYARASAAPDTPGPWGFRCARAPSL